MRHQLAPLATALLLAGCGTDHEADATLAVKDYVEAELAVLHQATLDLRAAAPEPDGDGWNATDDAAAITSMRQAWTRARAAYEHVEGAIAVLFPMLDVSTDERYDGFIEAAGDPDPFDGSGAIGMHAIERILWADEHPAEVVAFESTLEGYTEARMPETEAEARAFREQLLGRLIDDIEQMRRQFRPLALDPAAAFRGVIGSMAEQVEKVRLAATGEDESRYSQATLADMRANLEGGRAIYAHFREWIRSRDGGHAMDGAVVAGFDRIAASYSRLPGDSLPPVPAGWNPDRPDPAHLQTPYGRLFQQLTTESDPQVETSLVSEMMAAADAIEIPLLP